MLARVAENIYWMARYMERAEDMARLISVNANLALDLPKGLSPIWGQLIAITGAEALFAGNREDERSVLQFLVSDRASPVSILTCLAAARENARTIREVIPREVWETINITYLNASEQAGMALSKRDRFGFLEELIRGCQTLTGILAGTMNHDEGYVFLRIGRNLERADMTSRIIDIRSANLVPDAVMARAAYDNLQWMSVLRSLSGYQMYRREMQIRVQRTDVLRFLFRSAAFPRSISHCIGVVAQCVASLPHHEGALRVTDEIRRQLEEARLDLLRQGELQSFVDQLQIGFGDLHRELTRVYFSGLGASEAA